jgi:lysophospholipase L1-like esterase
VKKFFIVLVLFTFFSVLAYVGLQMRDVVVAKNYSDYWQQKGFDGGDYVYVVLGDGTGLGIGASSVSKSYVGLLTEKIKQTDRRVKVVNLSSKDADINTVINEQIPKIGNLKPDLVTLTIGMNDLSTGGLDNFVDDMKILLQLLPPRVSYISELPFTLEPNKEKIIRSANLKILELANIAGVNTVLLADTLNHKSYDFTIYDWGLRYPNDKGYAMWANAFWNSIQQ